MVSWHFDLQLIPSYIADNVSDFIQYDEDQLLETKHWWSDHQSYNCFKGIIEQAFPVLESSFSDIFRWGDADGILFEAFLEKGMIYNISVRIDTRNLSVTKLEVLMNTL